MQHVPIGKLIYEFSRHEPPRAELEPGESVLMDTEDAFSGQIRTNSDRRDKTRVPFSNPLTGPVYIRGAEPGDTLLVHIESIEPLIGQCATRTSDPQQLCQWLGDECPHGTHVCPIRDGWVYWSDQIRIPYRPMLGCIGTAPAWGTPTTVPAGPHGGNLDIREIAPGATVWLPVWVPGALLYVGDAHAAMGHGELSASGLEMPARTRLRIELRKGRSIAWPRIETEQWLMTVASGCPMERSFAVAAAHLILWLEEDFGWNRWRAYDLLTHVAESSIGYYAFGTVAVKVERRYVEAGDV
ncbi:MAG: acetamidase [Pirellulaceae bacterium]|nr:MAG: acetamidase [Pirellulaceae bacterium]